MLVLAYDVINCLFYACWLENIRPVLLANKIFGLFLLGVRNRFPAGREIAPKRLICGLFHGHVIF